MDPPPPLPLPHAQPEPQPQRRPINTYHCLCTHLLLATTHTLSSLPRRKAPGLDHAIILPLPPPPSTSTSSSGPTRAGSRTRSRSRTRSGSESSRSSNDDAGDDDGNNDAREAQDHNASKPKRHHNPKGGTRPEEQEQEQESQGYSILLSTTLDRKPIIVRREDGFEKRYLWRCGRCRVVVGYQVDGVHFLGTDKASSGGEKGGLSGRGSGRVGEVVFLLPGGLVRTEEMMAGGRGQGDERWEKGG